MNCWRRQAGFAQIPDISTGVAQFRQEKAKMGYILVMEGGWIIKLKPRIRDPKLLSASS